jgi:hypothetical protein
VTTWARPDSTRMETPRIMTTATLALYIGSAILAQVLGIALIGLYRQRNRYLKLGLVRKSVTSENQITP